MSVTPAMLGCIPLACRCPMMKVSGLVSSDRWAAFASSVPGLVLSASSVSDMVACLHLVGARQDMGSFIGRRHVGEVASPRRMKS